MNRQQHDQQLQKVQAPQPQPKWNFEPLQQALNQMIRNSQKNG